MKLPHTFTKESDNINAVVETPKDCSAKYHFDKETGSFKLKKVLVHGLVFPFPFGFIPFTHAEDGDPLDVLVLMDEPTWPGCYVECRVIGIIEAEEKEKQSNKKVRNDRVIAAAIESPAYKKLKELSSLEKDFVDEIINFFISYTRLEEKEFTVIGQGDADKALRVIKKLTVHGDNS